MEDSYLLNVSGDTKMLNVVQPQYNTMAAAKVS